MQDLFGGGVPRPVAKEALALGKRSRVGKAQAQEKPIKFKCHACAEQMHANTLLCVPGDGTDELRVGFDWERRGLEPGVLTMSSTANLTRLWKTLLIFV